MLERLGAWYSRRIVNVNVNIIAAGVLALGPVLLVVRLTEYVLKTGLGHYERLRGHHQLIISAMTFVSDVVFDVVIYYFLHWLANHAPFLKAARKTQLNAVADAAVESVPFFKDATKVQFQRAVISPLLYIIWLGLQFYLSHFVDMSVTWATVIGFVVAIGTARTLHTVWMIREERAFRARATAVGGAVRPPVVQESPPSAVSVGATEASSAPGAKPTISPAPPGTPRGEVGAKSVARS